MFVNERAIRKRIDIIKEQLNTLGKLTDKLPDGELVCAKNGKSYKWYKKQNGMYEYILKDNRKLAQKLALKKYYDMNIKDLQAELKACKAYMQKTKQNKEYVEKFLCNSEYEKLITCEIAPKNKQLVEWENAEFEGNRNFSDKLIVKGTNGKYLRSKSEAIIDRILFNAGIPFHYEEKLELGQFSFYPDFTIKHPDSGKIFYWEHFGMMDNPDYINSACSKIRIYCENGIIPSVNLILTYETKEHPLMIDDIEDIVKKYFYRYILTYRTQNAVGNVLRHRKKYIKIFRKDELQRIKCISRL